MVLAHYQPATSYCTAESHYDGWFFKRGNDQDLGQQRERLYDDDEMYNYGKIAQQ